MEEKNIKKSEQAIKEENILSFWQEKNIFKKSLEKESPKGEFVFYEGPPTANGKPGIHHLEARAFKDVIPRFKTMQGYHVRRKGGWDTHGLPVELQVEKELGLSSKKEIEHFGVGAFNKKCKESVWQYLDIWNKFTHRIGYWVDQKHPYITYHNSYIESLWNIVGEVNKKGLLYKDYKVVPWCPRCGTALSSHELAQGYQDVKDLSVYAKFKVKGQENTYILAWTTTPWTLPGNVALAVGEDIEYLKIKVHRVDFDSSEISEGDTLIFADTLETQSSIFGDRIGFDGNTCNVKFQNKGNVLFENKGEIIKGSNLIGLEYEPLYPYLKEALEAKGEDTSKAFKVYGADFVTTEDGTGVVHTAVMYGQDDFELGTKIGLPKMHTVDDTGHFVKGVGFLEGRFVKDESVAIDIIKDLAHRGFLFHKEKYEHSYPHCWRCKTPLIYYARDSWYIAMSKLRDELVTQNQNINWEPVYTKEGRFGEWLRDIKDWAISRERYWGTPLPVWQKENGGKVVIDSISTLKKYTKKSGNNYFVMRHGESVGNLTEKVSSLLENHDPLTEKGQEQARTQGEELKNKNIDLIIASPIMRTKETAEIVQKVLGLGNDQLIFDERLLEIQAGDFEGKAWRDYHEYLHEHRNGDWFHEKIPGGGESLFDAQKRLGSCLYELDEKYKDKNILIVTHGGPAWLLYVLSGEYLPDGREYQIANSHAFVKEFKRFQNAEVRELAFAPLPHTENFELDLHKPYIDEIDLFDEEGKRMIRTKEVMDVWFDSGAMPFAQDHYPFDNKEYIDTVGFPADYISEAIDQTRGWFYTLHAVGVLMGKGNAYKNVICLGHILDEKGKKMSKSLGNIVDPWEMIEKYGVDPLRFFMYTVNQPGESKNFDEKTVVEGVRKLFNLFYNVFAFYELYRDKDLETSSYIPSTHVLDEWIVVKLNQLIKDSENYLNQYKVLEPARLVRDFMDDLSTWYLRRSRDRIKDKDKDALSTLYYVLKELSKIMAPFVPFTAEDIYQKLRTENDLESVHLSSWPSIIDKTNEHILEEMERTREIVTLGLEARQKANSKVRQPLPALYVKEWNLHEKYRDIICDELNVKNVIHDEAIDSPVLLDLTITPELKAEGDMRELVRSIQDLRKKKGLLPEAEIVLSIKTDEIGQSLIAQFKDEIQKTVGASDIIFTNTEGEEVIIDELVFVINF